MPPKSQSTRFTATIRRTKDSALGLFALVPASISGSTLRRGRVTARIALGGASFEAVMEPDGQLGHWFRIPASVVEDAKVAAGDSATFVLTTLAHQPEPNLPAAFRNLLEASESAQQIWRRATALAKIDWVHWLDPRSRRRRATRERSTRSTCWRTERRASAASTRRVFTASRCLRPKKPSIRTRKRARRFVPFGRASCPCVCDPHHRRAACRSTQAPDTMNETPQSWYDFRNAVYAGDFALAEQMLRREPGLLQPHQPPR